MSAVSFQSEADRRMTITRLMHGIGDLANVFGWDMCPWNADTPEVYFHHRGSGRLLFRTILTGYEDDTRSSVAIRNRVSRAGIDASVWRPTDYVHGAVRRTLEGDARFLSPIVTAAQRAQLRQMVISYIHDRIRVRRMTA